MKLRENFILHRAGEKSYLVPVGGANFAGVVQGNDLLGEILSLLQEETSENAIVDALCDQIDAPRETLSRDVGTVIRSLREIGALEP